MVWSMAVKAYGGALDQVVLDAVGNYKRKPGLNRLTQLHLSTAGSAGLQSLVLALTHLGQLQSHAHGRGGNYVEIRNDLRWHIVRHLQRSLIEDGHADSVIRDDYFGTDLGL